MQDTNGHAKPVKTATLQKSTKEKLHDLLESEEENTLEILETELKKAYFSSIKF